MQKLPGHSLNESFAKMVKCNCNLHRFVPFIRIAVTQKHNLNSQKCSGKKTYEHIDKFKQANYLSSIKL